MQKKNIIKLIKVSLKRVSYQRQREKKDFIEFHKIQFMFYNKKQSQKIQCNSFKKQIFKL